MSDSTNRVRHEIGPKEGSIEEAQKQISEVDSANRAMVSNIRQGVQLGLFAAQAMGLMINQTLSLLIEALLLSIEVGLAISAGTFGLSQIFQIGTIIAMGILIVQIKQKRTKAAQQTQGVVSGLRMISFRSA